MLYSSPLKCGIFFWLLFYSIHWIAPEIEEKNCIVNGTTYFHRQKILSKDSNCHCVCIRGDVYCRWQQDYNNRSISSIALYESTVSIGENEKRKLLDSNRVNLHRATCFVMGKKYNVGEILPHSTGNCVECSCGDEGHVKCSPRNCAPSQLLEKPETLSNFDSDVSVNQIDLYRISREHGIDENF